MDEQDQLRESYRAWKMQNAASFVDLMGHLDSLREMAIEAAEQADTDHLTKKNLYSASAYKTIREYIERTLD